MKSRELQNLGIPKGEPVQLAIEAVKRISETGVTHDALRAAIKAVVEAPDSFAGDPVWGALAECLKKSDRARAGYISRTEPAPYRKWGSDMDTESVRQMENACNLPVSVAGALMPDAHVGYGLPIGGVLSTHKSVVPYAVC